MLTIVLKRAASPRLAGNLGLIALALSLSAPLAPTYAQATKDVPAPPSPAAPSLAAPTPSAPAATVLAQIGRAANVTVLADSAVGALQVQPPREATTPANFEQQIAAISRQLPPGTDWAKLMLPAPAPGHPWKGDDVAMFASAAYRLYGAAVFSRGSVAAPVPPGAASADMSLLAQPIPVAKASQYAADLHLQPVYIVANSNVRTASNSARYPLAGPGDMEAAMAPDGFTPVDPQAANSILSVLPQAQREQILDDLKRDPNSVRILSNGHGEIAILRTAPITITSEDEDGGPNSK